MFSQIFAATSQKEVRYISNPSFKFCSILWFVPDAQKTTSSRPKNVRLCHASPHSNDNGKISSSYLEYNIIYSKTQARFLPSLYIVAYSSTLLLGCAIADLGYQWVKKNYHSSGHPSCKLRFMRTFFLPSNILIGS